MMRSRKRLTALVLTGVLLAASVASFVSQVEATRRIGFGDFPIFLGHAKMFSDTGRLYRSVDDLSAYDPGTAIFKYPPSYMLFLLPLSEMGTARQLTAAHFVVQLLVYLASAGLAIYLMGLWRKWAFAAAALVVTLNFSPFIETLYGLQVETYVLLLFVVALLLLRRKADFGAGVAIAICGMVKLYPFFLFFHLALRRRWLAIVGGAAASLLLGLLSLGLFGAEENQVYYFRILPYLLGEAPVLYPENLGLGRYLRLLFVGYSDVAIRVGQALSLTLLSLSVYAVYRNRHRADDDDVLALEYSLFVTLILILLSNSWANYQMILLLPIFVLIRQSLEQGEKFQPVAWLTAGACLLLIPSENHPDMYPGYTLVVSQWVFESAIQLRVVPTLVIWGVLFWRLMAASSDATQEEYEEARFERALGA